jgi:hypothetical protein
VSEAVQLNLFDDLEDDGLSWHDWFMSLPRIPPPAEGAGVFPDCAAVTKHFPSSDPRPHPLEDAA